MPEDACKKINYFHLSLDLIFLIFLIYLSYMAVFNFSRVDFFLNCAESPKILRDFYNFNLIFHEFSHLVFTPLGEFMMFLGGTLGEFIFPLIFLFYFIKNYSYRGASFCLWWIGFNLITSSLYMKDAIPQQLPLLGGGGMHDWFYLFTRLGMLKHAVTIGNVVLIFGIIFIISALMEFGYHSVSKIKNDSRK